MLYFYLKMQHNAFGGRAQREVYRQATALPSLLAGLKGSERGANGEEGKGKERSPNPAPFE